MPSARVPGFDVVKHGFPFSNCFADGTPVVEIPTPFGTLGFGNAGVGVCGGMVYAVVDHFLFHMPIPQHATKLVFQYLCQRLLDSFGFPIGFGKYWDWQRRQGVTTTFQGFEVQQGVGPLTLQEWPRIRTVIDSGQLCPLGVVKIQSYNPWRMGQNHQVLAYGYIETGDNLTLDIYDPNYPHEPMQLSATVQGLATGQLVRHTVDYEHVRGFFPTEYTRPAQIPSL